MLCWINAITMALACYRNTTCMEGLSSGGKENVQLASEPRGCPQKYSLFIAPRPGTLSMLVSSFAVLLAPLHSIEKCLRFFSFPLSDLFVMLQLCSWASHCSQRGIHRRSRRQRGQANPGSSGLRADIDPFFSTSRVGA